MEKSIFTLLMLLSVFTNVITGQYSFVNYDYTNGLPLDEIGVIKEDSLGYIWLGGPLGLSRFDGRNFTHYYRGGSSGNVAGNIVNDIDITPSGQVVVVYDDNGISIYDHNTGKFRSKTFQEPDSLIFPMHSIFSAYIINDTSAYLCANREGLYHINLRTFQSRKIPIDFKPYDIIKDPRNDNSFIFSGKGLYRLNSITNETEKLGEEGFGGIQLKKNKIWLNTYGSMVLNYDINTYKVKKYPHNISVIRGWAFVDKNLWIGTAFGLSIFDTVSSKVINTLKAGTSTQGLLGEFIYEVFKDSKDRVWVATDGGLSMYDPNRINFRKTEYLPNQVTDLYPLSDGDFLTFDFYSQQINHLQLPNKFTKVAKGLGLKAPYKTINSDQGLIIVYYNGLGKYDFINKKIDPISSPFTSTKKRGLIDLIIFENKYLGIYRHHNIMVSWDTKSNMSETFDLGGEPKGMIETEDRCVWVYGMGVFQKFDLKDKSQTTYSLNNQELAPLAGDIVRIDKALDGYWISTRINGIWKADYKNGEFVLRKHYDEGSGLANNIVFTCIDEFLNLYVQTRSGIFMYDNKRDRFIQLGQKTEVNIQTTYNLVVIDSILHILGYQNKSLDLRKIKFEKDLPKIIFENITINDERVNKSNLEVLSLKHNENNINFSYNALAFNDPSSIKFRYRLDDLSEWFYPHNYSNNIYLSSLNSGDYNFQLSATDGSGEWTLPIEWPFIIKAVYWKSWWFFLTIIFLIGTSGFIFYRYRMNQIRKIGKMQIQLAELKSESLRSQMNPHFVFNALNSIKSYIIKNNREEAADYLTTFSELIRAVLRNSTQKEISLKDEIEALSLYLQIENLRLNQKFVYNIEIADDINASMVAFPPLIIQPFVENSIWHGFTNKKENGLLNIIIYRDKSKLIIEIIDDGIGREASKKIEKSRDRKRSYGIAITKTRLHNIMEKADIEIEDIYNDLAENCGTKVVIHLPFHLLETKI